MKLLGGFAGAADDLEETKQMEKILEKRQKKKEEEQKKAEQDPAKDGVEDKKEIDRDDIPTMTDNEAVD